MRKIRKIIFMVIILIMMFGCGMTYGSVIPIAISGEKSDIIQAIKQALKTYHWKDDGTEIENGTKLTWEANLDDKYEATIYITSKANGEYTGSIDLTVTHIALENINNVHRLIAEYEKDPNRNYDKVLDRLSYSELRKWETSLEEQIKGINNFLSSGIEVTQAEKLKYEKTLNACEKIKKKIVSKVSEKYQETKNPDPIVNPDFYDPSGSFKTDEQFLNMGNTLITVLRALGTIIAIVALMFLGFKYMTGTVADKASYKETMIPYLIGAVMVFTIPYLLGIVYDIVVSIDGE